MKLLTTITLLILTPLAVGQQNQTITAMRHRAPSGPTLYSDTFPGSGALSANWTKVFTGTSNGTICQASGFAELCATGYLYGAYLYNNGVSTTNGFVQCDFLYDTTHGNRGGCIFRATVTGTGTYYKSVTGSATDMVIYAVSNGGGGGGSYVYDFGVPTMTNGNWYTLRIYYTGTSFVAWFGAQGAASCSVSTGLLVNESSWTDSTYATGSPGIQIDAINDGTQSSHVESFCAQ
jgi:hypothetical protein